MQLLFEIGTEELPAGEVERALADLVAHVQAGAAAERLSIGEVRTYATPRRLALIVDDVAPRAEDMEEVATGPSVKVAYDKDGNPSRAAQGFARGKGIDPSELIQVETPKGLYIATVVKHVGADAATVLTGVLRSAFHAIKWKRSMHWGWEQETFARPVHWIVALLDDAVLDVCFADASAGRETYGHRFMAPEAITLKSPGEYLEALRGVFVMADIAERRQAIVEGVQQLAADAGLRPLMTEELVDEVVQLVEWPVPLLGRFPEDLLQVPREVLITSMASHQRYFALESDEGQLANAFAFVSNMVVERPEVVIAGNRRVLLARLEDARFFYREDRKRSLESRLTDLESILYIDGLGSVRARADRLVSLATTMAETLYPGEGEVASHAGRAALLAKADLPTGMVIEFTKLQGTMGRYYAVADGEPAEVAVAIEEHYAPRSAADAPPTTKAGVAVALADKLDAIVGCFALNLIPSGSADPYGLRRAALGLIRTSIDRGLRFDLDAALSAAFTALPEGVGEERKVLGQVKSFVRGRLKALIADEYGADIADAVVAVALNDLPSATTRAQVLTGLRDNADFAPLAAAFKRVVNILKKAKRGDIAEAVDADRLVEDAERALWSSVEAQRAAIERARDLGAFDEMAELLVALKGAIDTFFDDVMVNAEDPAVRANRLALLAEIRRLFLGFADISKVQ